MNKAMQFVGGLGLAIVLAGCATTGQATNPEEEIRADLHVWAAAFIAHDMDTVMEYYSEDFSHYEYGDKAGLRSFLQGAIDMGMMDNTEVDISGAQVVVEDDTAKVSPIGVTATFGAAVVGLTMEQESGDWKVVAMDVEMQ